MVTVKSVDPGALTCFLALNAVLQCDERHYPADEAVALLRVSLGDHEYATHRLEQARRLHLEQHLVLLRADVLRWPARQLLQSTSQLQVHRMYVTPRSFHDRPLIGPGQGASPS